VSYASRIKEYRTVRSDEIQRNSLNFRRHPETQRAALRGLLTSVGRVAPLLAYTDSSGALVCLDGHARLDESDEWDVAILDIDESEAATVLAMLDKIGADAEIDPAALLALLDTLDPEARQTASAAWSDDELAALIGSAVPDEPEDDEPVVIDETKPTRCQAGDVWRIGRHTVSCSDSTDRANVERLIDGRKVGMVVADPPYGVNFDPAKERGGPFGGVAMGGKVIPSIPRPAVIGDATTATARAAVALSLDLFRDAIQVWFGANNYADCLPPSQCWLVWDKENTGDFADVELAWTNQQSAARLFRHMWNGMLKDSERGERRVHATQKPVALFAWLYSRFDADLIFDPFLGSGPSLKAAEASGRAVVGCELSPHYIDHIIEWAEGKGLTVERADH
jgi:DNA modification methylase